MQRSYVSGPDTATLVQSSRGQSLVVWGSVGRAWGTGEPQAGPASGSWPLLVPRSPRVFTALPPEGDLPSECHLSPLQVFEEEHHVLYLDHGGVIAAIKDTSIPLKILK